MDSKTYSFAKKNKDPFRLSFYDRGIAIALEILTNGNLLGIIKVSSLNLVFDLSGIWSVKENLFHVTFFVDWNCCLRTTTTAFSGLISEESGNKILRLNWLRYEEQPDGDVHSGNLHLHQSQDKYENDFMNCRCYPNTVQAYPEDN